MEACITFDALYLSHVEMYSPVCALVVATYSYGVDHLPMMSNQQRIWREV